MRTSYELYLIRHGLAEERGDAWPDDAKRPLTAEGISRLRRAASALARLEMPADVVLTSPLVRTRQTAEIVAGALSPHPPVVTVDALAIGGPPTAIAVEIENNASSHIVIVGHEPGIGDLAAWLIGLAQTGLEFKKRGICRIDVEGSPAARASAVDADAEALGA
jgi:phosphohistidine phosphatase